MDVLPRIIRQLTERFHEMSSAQRVMTFVVLTTVSCGFSWLVYTNQRADLQPVSFGKVFPTDELASAEQALISAGLTDFRRDGQRILAPVKDLDKYNAALLEFDALPADLGSQMLKQFETLGPFSTDRQRQQMKDALLLQELRRMIKAVPDVEDAHVVIAASERRTGWNKSPRSTANITLKPRPGREISATLINSLRHVVANMVPDLKSTDVTIFDVSRGEAYVGEIADDPAEKLCQLRSKEYSKQLEQKVLKALAHIRQIGVAVHVDIEAIRSVVVRHEPSSSPHQVEQVASHSAPTNEERPYQAGFRGAADGLTDVGRTETEKQIADILPRATRVSVSLPRDFIREIEKRRMAKRDRSTEQIDPSLLEDEVITQVERIVGRLIPENAPMDAVSVTCVDRLANDSVDGKSKLLDDPLLAVLQQWSIPASIAAASLLVLVALQMMRKTISPIEDTPQNEVAVQPLAEINEALPEITSPVNRTPEVVKDRAALLRDEIRTMVASDPAASAALLSQWLSESTL